MTELHRNAAVLLKRAEGRLINLDGQLGLVLAVDCDAQVARVSCKVGEERQIIDLDLSQLALLLTEQQGATHDNLQSSGDRVSEENGAWYFSSRDGKQGPFGSEDEARDELKAYVLAQQASGPYREAAAAGR